ncbi:MAG: hypothetical protein RI953_818 [Pseudomonadota bacterium]
MTEKPVSLELRNVVFGYSNQEPTINGLSISIRAGERVSVLGNSGIGKSSLLRVIAGLERISAGMICLHEKIVSGPGHHELPERRRVGMVFQDWAVFPHLTVFKNIAFGLATRGTSPEDRGRVEQMLQEFEISELSGRMPDTLSGGQLQRVACARAIAPRPEILLLDEAFSSLDVDLRGRVRQQVITALEHEGTTSLLVTHDPIEAFEFAHRVFTLENGRLIEKKKPAAT